MEKRRSEELLKELEEANKKSTHALVTFVLNNPECINLYDSEDLAIPPALKQRRTQRLVKNVEQLPAPIQTTLLNAGESLSNRAVNNFIDQLSGTTKRLQESGIWSKKLINLWMIHRAMLLETTGINNGFNLLDTPIIHQSKSFIPWAIKELLHQLANHHNIRLSTISTGVGVIARMPLISENFTEKQAYISLVINSLTIKAAELLVGIDIDEVSEADPVWRSVENKSPQAIIDRFTARYWPTAKPSNMVIQGLFTEWLDINDSEIIISILSLQQVYWEHFNEKN